VSIIEPLRVEPYRYGLELAERVGDLDGVRWSSLGILRQAWPKGNEQLVDRARRAAQAALEKLAANGQSDEAAAFSKQLDEAKQRDIVVKVTWTGDADVDVMVEEQGGTVCSFRHPRTTAGGVMLGDAASVDGKSHVQGVSEMYVCPEAFDGTYRVLLRRVWGKVTAGKVTVDVYHHYGAEDQQHMRQQVPLGQEDQLVAFDFEGGRRKDSVADHLLINAASEQMAINQTILAQQLNSLSSAGAGADFNNSRQGMFGVPIVQQGVGYQPVITVLPTGTSLTVTGVVSADRRYVRITPTPLFSGVGSVTTFNIQSGTSSTTNTGNGQPIGSNPNDGTGS
jgi:hypothetical protein